MNDTQTSGSGATQRPAAAVRWLTAAAVLALAGSYLAAQIDYFRRHQPGITPRRYLWPQFTHIWAPGVGVALALGIIALVLHLRARRRSLQSGAQSVASDPDHG